MFTLPQNRGRGMPRPYGVVIFGYCNNRKTPGTVKTVPYKPPIRENQTSKKPTSANFIGGAVRRERVGGASKNVS